MSQCISIPSSVKKRDSAQYTGDRTTHSLGSLVFSVPLEGSKRPYENLHVTVTAIVNPLETVYGETTYDAVKIIDRTEARIRASLYRHLIFSGPANLETINALPAKIIAITEKTFRPVYKKWKYADKFSVEFQITAFYFSERFGPRYRTYHYSK